MAAKVRYTTVNGRIISQNKGGVYTRLLSDPLGNVIATVDASGVKTNDTTYWPYGEVRTGGVSTVTSLGFCGAWGYYTDASARLYVRARYYRPLLGRWQTKDQLWPGEIAYGYARLNPRSLADPSGLVPTRLNMGGSNDCCGQGGTAWFFPALQPAEDGWLIQRIKRTENGHKCGSKDALPAMCPPTYFEAWKVSGGKVGVPTKDGSWDFAADANHDEWKFSQGTACTEGDHSITGELMFVKGAIPAGFRRNNPDFDPWKTTCPNVLPVSLRFSGFVKQGGGAKFAIEWGCCKKPKGCKTQVDECSQCAIDGKCIYPVVTITPAGDYEKGCQPPKLRRN